jgi:hypothetical protein
MIHDGGSRNAYPCLTDAGGKSVAGWGYFLEAVVNERVSGWIRQERSAPLPRGARSRGCFIPTAAAHPRSTQQLLAVAFYCLLLTATINYS